VAGQSLKMPSTPTSCASTSITRITSPSREMALSMVWK
jgi:hypothetical protein